MMTDIAIRHDIDKFALEVRLALKDLGTSEVSELTEGLEADLAAQAEEQGSDFALPDSGEYARELREAAGLPSYSRGVFGFVDRSLRIAAHKVASSPLAGAVLRFLVGMAPIWWIGRAYIAFCLFEVFVMHTRYAYFPRSPFEWIVLIALLVASTQLGRKTANLRRFWQRTVSVLNLLAILVAPLTLSQASAVAADSLYLYENGAQLPAVEVGLKLNSQQVDNIFVYDDQGNPLKDVQLFTQSGEPLSVEFNGLDFPQVVFQSEFLDAHYVENQRAGRGSGWNVFPLQMVSLIDSETVVNGDYLESVPIDTPMPFPTVPALREVAPR